MKIFIDSSKFEEISRWIKEGVVDGVTTNPSIMKKDGVQDVRAEAARICKLIGDLPLSVEVTHNDPAEMLLQARAIATWAPNMVIKIPIINENGDSCLGVINALAGEGVAVNATALMTFNQAMLATKAGAAYVSIFAGRIADEGNDPWVVIRNIRHWLDDWSYTAKTIVGSIRTAMDIQSSALAGAHVVTVPPPFFAKMVDHKYTRETVRQFNQDAMQAEQSVCVKAAVAGR